jgi:hypothetical protein
MYDSEEHSIYNNFMMVIIIITIFLLLWNNVDLICMRSTIFTLSYNMVIESLHSCIDKVQHNCIGILFFCRHT